MSGDGDPSSQDELSATRDQLCLIVIEKTVIAILDLNILLGKVMIIHASEDQISIEKERRDCTRTCQVEWKGRQTAFRLTASHHQVLNEMKDNNRLLLKTKMIQTSFRDARTDTSSLTKRAQLRVVQKHLLVGCG
jgi:hypothetical protein